MRLHVFFCIYFFQSSFSDARSINASKRKQSQLCQLPSTILCMPVLLFSCKFSIALMAAPRIPPTPNKWYILVHLFSLQSLFCILCRAQEGCGLLFTFKWGKLAFAWFLQYNAYFTFKREKRGGNKTQHVRWVTCFILVQASLSLLLQTAFHRT